MLRQIMLRQIMLRQNNVASNDDASNDDASNDVTPPVLEDTPPASATSHPDEAPPPSADEVDMEDGPEGNEDDGDDYYDPYKDTNYYPKDTNDDNEGVCEENAYIEQDPRKTKYEDAGWSDPSGEQ